jgi:hypothetical protein
MDLFFSLMFVFLQYFSVDYSFFFKPFCNKRMICIFVFFKRSYSTSFAIRNWSFPRMSFWIYSNYWILITMYATHYLCVLQINFYIIIHTIKKFNIKRFFHVASNFSFAHAIFSSFLSFFLHCHFLDYYLFMFGHLGFLHICLLELHHSYIFQYFIVTTYHIFICQKLFHWLAVFTRLCPI